MSLLFSLFVSFGPADTPKLIRVPLAEHKSALLKAPSPLVPVCALAPDGKKLATFMDGMLSVFAVGEAKPLFTRPDTVTGRMAFSPDGALLAFAGKDHRVNVVSAATGKERLTLPLGASDGIDHLVFSPDSQRLAVSSGVLYHKDLRVFDAASGKLLGMPLKDVDGMAYQLFFTDDGKRLVANHYFQIYVIDAETFDLKVKLTKVNHPIVFAEGEKLFAVPADAATIHALDAAIAKEASGRFGDKLEGLNAHRVAVAGRPPRLALPHGNEVSIRDKEGRMRFRVTGSESPVGRVHLSADGRVLAVERQNGSVEVFQLK